MSIEQFNHLLKTTPGIGVNVTTANGQPFRYFYKDNGEEAGGIRRAMTELYPLMDQGIISGLTFIEGEGARIV